MIQSKRTSQSDAQPHAEILHTTFTRRQTHNTKTRKLGGAVRVEERYLSSGSPIFLSGTQMVKNLPCVANCSNGNGTGDGNCSDTGNEDILLVSLYCLQWHLHALEQLSSSQSQPEVERQRHVPPPILMILQSDLRIYADSPPSFFSSQSRLQSTQSRSALRSFVFDSAAASGHRYVFLNDVCAAVAGATASSAASIGSGTSLAVKAALFLISELQSQEKAQALIQTNAGVDMSNKAKGRSITVLCAPDIDQEGNMCDPMFLAARAAGIPLKILHDEYYEHQHQHGPGTGTGTRENARGSAVVYKAHWDITDVMASLRSASTSKSISVQLGSSKGKGKGKVYKGIVKECRQRNCALVELIHPDTGTGAGTGTALLKGYKKMNRCMVGDEVAVILCGGKTGVQLDKLTLLDQEHWKKERERKMGMFGEAEGGDVDVEDFACSDDDDDEEDDDEEESLTSAAGTTFATTDGATDAFNIPLARVVCVLNRDAYEFVARIPPRKDTYRDINTSNNTSRGRFESILAIPLKSYLPHIRIGTRYADKYRGKLCIISFESWPTNSLYPLGRIVKILGENSDWNTHVKALLVKYDVNVGVGGVDGNAFSEAAMACLPPLPLPVPVPVPVSETIKTRRKKSLLPLTTSVPLDAWKPSPSSYSSRIDLRDGSNSDYGSGTLCPTYRLFSVDPQGCEDIDDAMYCSWLGQGQAQAQSQGQGHVRNSLSNYENTGMLEIGVCIADVSHFLPHQSPLDIEARQRGTTVYLPHTRIDMLPSLLAGNVCSLHANVDRYAVCLQWRFQCIHKSSGRALGPHDDLLALDDQGEVEIIIDDSSASSSKRKSEDSTKSTGDAYDADDADLHLYLPMCGRAIMRSVATMTYEQAHRLLQGLSPDEPNLAQGQGQGERQGESIKRQAGGPVPAHLHASLRADLVILTVVGRALKRARERVGCGVTAKNSREEQGQIQEQGNKYEVGGRISTGTGEEHADKVYAAQPALDLSHMNGGTQLKFEFCKQKNKGVDKDDDDEQDKYDENQHNATLLPCKIHPPVHLEIHDTIAELMILSNSSVARVLKSHPSTSSCAVLRIHPPPLWKKVKEVFEFVETLGVGIDMEMCIDAGRGSSSTDMSVETTLSSLRLLRRALVDRQKRGLLSSNTVDYVITMIITAMNEAKYISAGDADVDVDVDFDMNTNISTSTSTSRSGIGNGRQRTAENRSQMHTGLGLKYYTHFTSPIRRYADVMVHRQFLHVLDAKARVRGEGKGKGEGEGGREGAIAMKGLFDSSVGESSVNAVPIPIPIPVAGHGKLEANVEQVEEENNFLDDLLGDIGDDLLSAIQATALTPSSSSSSAAIGIGTGLACTSNFEAVLTHTTPVFSSISTTSALSLIAPYIDTADIHGPYNASQVSLFTTLLNKRTRNARSLSQECQLLFLKLYFAGTGTSIGIDSRKIQGEIEEEIEGDIGKKGIRRVEKHVAIIQSLRNNGFIAYIPTYHIKLPVFLTDRSGVVTLPECSIGTGIGCNGRAGTGAGIGIEQCAHENWQCDMGTDANGQYLRIVDKATTEIEVLMLRVMQSVTVLLSGAEGDEDFPVIRTMFLGASLLVSTDVEAAMASTITTTAETKRGLGLPRNTSAPTSVPIPQEKVLSLPATTIATSADSATTAASTSNTDKDTGSGACMFVTARALQKLPLAEVIRLTSSSRISLLKTASSATATATATAVANVTGKDSSNRDNKNKNKNKKNDKEKETENPSVAVSRISVRGSGGGRIFFTAGLAASSHSLPLALPPAFKEMAVTAASASASTHTSAANDGTGQLGTYGRDAAIARMQEWGEEWAEEEELPGMCGGTGAGSYRSEQYIGADTPLGLLAISGGMSKETQLASSRLNKVKTAKRHAKY